MGHRAECPRHRARRDRTPRHRAVHQGRGPTRLGEGRLRLAGLYALERLGQNNPNQRETILNVICAYLRMPHAAPDAQEEEQVRLTAQRILVRHRLYHTDDWWEVPPLDLTGADLTKADLTRANRTDANLADADLTDAVLTDANLYGADLPDGFELPPPT